MLGNTDERSPLLQFPGSYTPQVIEDLPDAYKQFCLLIGNKPADHPADKSYHPPQESLYHRAVAHRKRQNLMYAFTSALTNTLLLSQVVLGAALTGLGASDSSRVLITVFGALNTIIAGLIAFLKSRGQPMRARMFRDDLDRVVDEIENSATMWKGIAQRVHGYDAIDTDESVTVRSEVARLTRLYDRAVRTSTANDPDHYGPGITPDQVTSGLRSRTGQPLLATMPTVMPIVPDPSGPATTPTPAIPGPAADPDESPATKARAPSPSKKADATPTTPPADDKPAEDKGKHIEQPPPSEPSAPAPEPSAPAPLPLQDPDESPATKPVLPKTNSDSKFPGDGQTSGGAPA